MKVVINYVASAGIALTITFIYYHFVHEQSPDTLTFSAIDELYLGWVRECPRRLLKWINPGWVQSQKNSKSTKAFIKVRCRRISGENSH